MNNVSKNKMLVGRIEDHLLEGIFSLNELNDYMESKGLKRDIKEEEGMYFIYNNKELQILINFTFISYIGSLKNLYQIDEVMAWIL